MYYFLMVQPKTPPLSVRLSPEVLATLDRVVQKSGWTRNAAIGHLVELGADAFDAMPKYVVKPGAAPAKPSPAASAEPMRMPRAAFGERLKGPKPTKGKK